MRVAAIGSHLVALVLAALAFASCAHGVDGDVPGLDTGAGGPGPTGAADSDPIGVTSGTGGSGPTGSGAGGDATGSTSSGASGAGPTTGAGGSPAATGGSSGAGVGGSGGSGPVDAGKPMDSCVPEADVAFCSRLNKACGMVTAA